MKQLLTNNNAIVSMRKQPAIRQRIIFLGRCFTILAAVLLLMAGCKKTNGKTSVTLHADFETVSTVLQAGPPELDSIKGIGTGTPIGVSSFITHAQFDANNQLTGNIVATAENGDKFYASITGHDPDIDTTTGSITLHFQAVITGGTGKFSGATGNFAGVAHESFYTPEGTATWDGTIIF